MPSREVRNIKMKNEIMSCNDDAFIQKKKKGGVAIQQVKNPTIICEDVG